MFDAGRRLKYERRDLNGGFASPVLRPAPRGGPATWKGGLMLEGARKVKPGPVFQTARERDG